jgi:hypothetical protein
LNQASSSLMAGDIDNAKAYVKKAISLEQQSKSLLGRLKNLEKQIYRYTKREISMEKKFETAGAY